ncbi:Protein of unknown function [Cognatiyoonia koreensis]|uniref:VWFA domain-containing protein n=1 Tax=Cognatiyoonia koreensis TaxID=364200 RepID=A0A1I0Q8W5_9RHOB|nr:DUF1194 domain-containing protein [Cognatiyoonia koreensis]SEW23247.1 Protein of unknown function [Cognatiyoonia koreensis]
MRTTLAFLICLWGAQASAQCRQALALGLDVSGSVNAEEYRLQIDGLASALESTAVQKALLGGSNAPVRVLVYEWAGSDDSTLILPWLTINSAADITTATTTLRAHQRGPQSPTTALGAALRTGFAYLSEQPDCWKQTLDISGDGPSNTGPRPQDIARPAEIIVNGLVIGADDPDIGDQRQEDIKSLSSYYRAYVIGGPDAFVETAAGFSSYATAMERKLLRELQALAIGQLVDQ